jgi:hypothetical protein
MTRSAAVQWSMEDGDTIVLSATFVAYESPRVIIDSSIYPEDSLEPEQSQKASPF